MAIWELIVDALTGARDEGREWLGSGEIARRGGGSARHSPQDRSVLGEVSLHQ